MTAAGGNATPRAGLVARVAVVLLGGAGFAISLVIVGPLGTALFLASAGIGGYLAVRAPTDARRIGWLLILAGWGLTLGTARLPFDPAILVEGGYGIREALYGWASSSGWALALSAYTALVLIFPSGRLAAGRSGVARVLIVVSVAIAALIAFGPTINVTVAGSSAGLDAPNPFALVPISLAADALDVPVLYPVIFAVFVCALAMLLARYSRSSGPERLQYRWIVAAIVLFAILNGTWAIVTFLLHQDATGPAYTATVLGYLCVPIAIAIAVLRYRLYAIDRIISRTLGWTLVTVLLVAVFAAAVLGLQAVLAGFAQQETLAVAASTLVAAVLFQPLRTRIQAAVDRRFDRSRYDAGRLVDAFAGEIRNDVDLAAVGHALLDAADHAVRPVGASVWLRPASSRQASRASR